MAEMCAVWSVILASGIVLYYIIFKMMKNGYMDVYLVEDELFIYLIYYVIAIYLV